MKKIALILSLLLLTSCSNPDTSGGVTLAKSGGDHHNNFPYGSCKGHDQFDHNQKKTGCGWNNVKFNYYIAPHADLRDTDLRYADLRGADLSGAYLRDVKANSRTICPNGKKWGTAGNDCGF